MMSSTLTSSLLVAVVVVVTFLGVAASFVTTAGAHSGLDD